MHVAHVVRVLLMFFRLELANTSCIVKDSETRTRTRRVVSARMPCIGILILITSGTCRGLLRHCSGAVREQHKIIVHALCSITSQLSFYKSTGVQTTYARMIVLRTLSQHRVSYVMSIFWHGKASPVLQYKDSTRCVRQGLTVAVLVVAAAR